MQSKFTGISFAIAGLLAAVCFWQQQQLRQTRARLVEAEQFSQSAQSTQELVEKKIQQLEQHRSNLESQVSDLVAEGAIMRATVAQSRSKPIAKLAQTNAELNDESLNEENNSGGLQKGMAKMIQDMMKDPAMKEMILAQQKASINMMYGSLFKDLKLSPDDKEKFTDLMAESQSGALENMDVLLGEDQNAKTSVVESMKEGQNAVAQKIRDLLGEEKYAQYQEYQGSVGERMQLDQFKAQLTGTDSALKEDQINQLLQLMKEERIKNPPAFSSNPAESVKDFSKIMSEESMEKLLQWQEKVNLRVLEGAAQILSDEQAKRLKTFQEQQLNMQRLGIKMAAGMFGKKSNATESIQATPGTP